ncbi:WAS/WASL-interacting protein family member 1-like [Trichosurus vulpecula]|uniref:WAS/WASL-interacting protein family member 1-like n=1 Tax=Trichosurus vulpecula TaxID=9337 RepID=UPI00186ABF70|nr:WAS/WASL-interacting protein family member 1-like [Trichosurus vulpecula]
MPSPGSDTPKSRVGVPLFPGALCPHTSLGDALELHAGRPRAGGGLISNLRRLRSEAGDPREALPSPARRRGLPGEAAALDAQARWPAPGEARGGGGGSGVQPRAPTPPRAPPHRVGGCAPRGGRRRRRAEGAVLRLALPAPSPSTPHLSPRAEAGTHLTKTPAERLPPPRARPPGRRDHGRKPEPLLPPADAAPLLAQLRALRWGSSRRSRTLRLRRGDQSRLEGPNSPPRPTPPRT